MVEYLFIVNDSTRYLMIFVLLVKLQVMRLEITWRGDAPLKSSFPDWRITEKKKQKGWSIHLWNLFVMK